MSKNLVIKNLKEFIKTKMTRTTRGSVAKKTRKKIKSFAKGFVGAHSKLFRIAKQQMMKALRYAFSDRRKKKNQIKRIWITRINASARKIKIKYNQLINFKLLKSINLNKKLLSESGVKFTMEYIVRK